MSEKPYTGNVTGMKPTFEQIDSALSYDPITGVIRWKITPNRRIRVGDIAGSVSHGYNYVRFNRQTFKASHIAWMLFHGKFPENMIDHANLDRLDDRIQNLREANSSQNGYNTAIQARNKTGYKGVFLVRSTGMFKAYITENGERRNLGHHRTAIDAHRAVESMRSDLHGEFARTA